MSKLSPSNPPAAGVCLFCHSCHGTHTALPLRLTSTNGLGERGNLLNMSWCTGCIVDPSLHAKLVADVHVACLVPDEREREKERDPNMNFKGLDFEWLSCMELWGLNSRLLPPVGKLLSLPVPIPSQATQTSHKVDCQLFFPAAPVCILIFMRNHS